MSKSNFFTGQPIFNQLLNFIPRAIVHEVAAEFNADHYYKTFKTYDHLVTMLYAIFNHCTSIREVTTGLLAWEYRIHHLGVGRHPRRSTIAEANKSRNAEVFERIYYRLLNKYQAVLPDSRKRSKKNNLYIFDSTTITLFKEILKGSGLTNRDGKRKGGIKVHTLLHAASDVPVMIRYSEAINNDANFLKQVTLPPGSVIVFDKGYRDYSTYNRFTENKITWVTRHRDSSIYKIIERNPISEYQRKCGIMADLEIILGHDHSKHATKVPARMVQYKDPNTHQIFTFITNNRILAPFTIAQYYKQRWQIETFFKRIKQNYPVQYFLGDNENAIKIQIWCALIADLILKVMKQGTQTKMSFSNIVGLIRHHLMTYMDVKNFIKSPEKSLLIKIRSQNRSPQLPSLFPT
jgi:transposase